MNKAKIVRAPGDISNKVLAATIVQLVAAVIVAALSEGWGAPSTVAAINAVLTFGIGWLTKDTLATGGKVVTPAAPANEVDPEDYGV